MSKFVTEISQFVTEVLGERFGNNGCPGWLPGHTSVVTACQLFADGRRALSASTDNTMRLWDLTTGETLRVYLALESGTACFDPRPIRNANDHTPRLIHAAGEIWRHLAWQVPTADGGWERVPLETFGDVVQDD